MLATRLAIPDLVLLETRRFDDQRGFFTEVFNDKTFRDVVGVDASFVQDNYSRSLHGVLRGLHYQLPPHAQGKLVRVLRGRVFDVAVDIRRHSATFGRWVGIELGEDDNRQLWIPPGFAHGFVALSDVADLLYKVTDYYAPECERCIQWDDPAIGVTWPLTQAPVLSPKDCEGVTLAAAEAFSVAGAQAEMDSDKHANANQ